MASATGVGSCGGFSNEAKDEKEAKDKKANSAHIYNYAPGYGVGYYGRAGYWGWR